MRVVLLRGHEANVWDLASWERLTDRYDVEVLVTGSNLYSLDGLALPVRRPGIAETGNEASEENFARHGVAELEIGDSNDPNAAPALMQIGKLRVRAK